MNRLFDSFDVLLPREQLEKWAVIACDQFTSEPGYWDGVKACVGDAPSAYRCILPEVELGEAGNERYAQIRRSMRGYLGVTSDGSDSDVQKPRPVFTTSDGSDSDVQKLRPVFTDKENSGSHRDNDGAAEQGVFYECKDSFIYVERTLEDGSVRQGLVGVIDLEDFDYHAGSVSLIRPTERTVEERIPARLRIRSNALLELSHVLLLCDDDEFSLIEPFSREKDTLTRLYDFDLMQGGGHIAGWLVDGRRAELLRGSLDAYYDRKAAEMAGTPPIYFAVGDGNHSLAAAKANYERLKELAVSAASADHPAGTEESAAAQNCTGTSCAAESLEESVRLARYAMVELVNIRSESMVFEPIHRILTGVKACEVIDYLREECGADQAPESADGDKKAPSSDVRKFSLGVCTCEGCFALTVPGRGDDLPVMIIQDALDKYLKEHSGSIDYIHGADTVRELSNAPDSVGLILPDIDKAGLFRWIAANGPLPRKTFSLGHAREKRYYLETRRL